MHQASVTTSRVTCFIMQAHTGLATSNASANNGEDVEKMTLNGSGRSKFETKKSLAIDEVCVAMF